MTRLNDPSRSSATEAASTAEAAERATLAHEVPDALSGGFTPRRWVAVLTTPEAMTSALLVAAFAVAASVVPNFLDARYLLDRSSLYMETGVMAVAMTFVVIGGHIDLSCASILALVGAVVTLLGVKVHLPIAAMLLLAVALGGILGAVNGAVVAGLGLPSLVVTLATMAAYRGLAQVLIGDQSVRPPKDFVGIDQTNLAGTILPIPLVVWLGLAAALGLVLHRTVAGRWVSSMGTSPGASLYSGVPVACVTFGVFVLSGVLSAVAGMMMVSRLGVARYDNGSGLELDVVTAVVLGGTNIFGGRGTMFGTVIALLLIAVLQTGMGVANIKSEYQTTANGALLIFAVLASNLLTRRRK